MADKISKKCIKQVLQASKDLMSEAEAEGFLQAVQNRVQRRRDAGNQQMIGDLIREEGTKLLRDFDASTKLRKRNALLNMEAVREMNALVNEVPGSEQVAFKSMFVGNESLSMYSVDAAQKGLKIEWGDGFAKELEATGHSGGAIKGEFEVDLATEIAQLSNLKGEGQPGISKNPVAQKVAEVIFKWQKLVQLERNRAGGAVATLDEFIERQSHDSNRIRQAGAQTWLEEIKTLLDFERSFPDVQAKNLDEVLLTVYDSLVTGQHFAHGAGKRGLSDALQESGKLVWRGAQERVLHFKDPASYVKYNQKYGNGTITESFMQSIDFAAEEVGLHRRFGPGFEQNIDAVRKTLIKKLRAKAARGTIKEQGAATAQINKLLRKGEKGFSNVQRTGILKKGVGFFLDMADWIEPNIDHILAELDGTTKSSVNATWAHRLSAVRAAISMSKLTKSTISSLTDFHNSASLQKHRGKGYFESVQGNFEQILKGKPPEIQDRMKMLVGVYSNRVIGESHRRMNATDNPSKRTSHLLNRFFKLTFQTQLDQFHRTAIIDTTLADIGMASKKAWKDIDEPFRRFMTVYGFDEATWPMFREISDDFADNITYVAPERIQDLPDDFVAKMMTEKAPSERQIRLFRSELANKMFALVQTTADQAVPVAGANERAFLLRGSQAGTVVGEVHRFVAQFKSFPAAQVMKVWMRETVGRLDKPATQTGVRGFVEGLEYGKGSWPAMGQFVLMSAAWGYLAMSAKDILANKEPRSINSASTWTAALMQGGGLGIFGDFIFGDFNRYGASPVETLAGPAASDFANLVKLWSKFRDGDDFAAATVKTMFSNMGVLAFLPGRAGLAAQLANTWYTRAALDYMLVYQLQDTLNPGFFDRQRKRLQKEDRDFIFDPR